MSRRKAGFVRNLLFALILAIVLTWVKFPFGAIDYTTGHPGAIGTNHHTFLSFLTFDIVDFGHTGSVNVAVSFYAFGLNLIFAYILIELLMRYYFHWR
jgi:hypothetical protein